jgi:hypothetical protein
MERQTGVLASLDRLRLEDDMARQREEDWYYDDITLERRRRGSDSEEEIRLRAEDIAIDRERERDEAVRGHLRRGREEDIMYGGGEYDDEREKNLFAPVRPIIGRRATVGYGYRG